MLKWLQRAFGKSSELIVVGEGSLADAVAGGAGERTVSRIGALASPDAARSAKAVVFASGNEIADLEKVRALAVGWPKPANDAAEVILAVACDRQKTITALQDLDAELGHAGLRIRPLSAAARTARLLLQEHSFARLHGAGRHPVVVGTGHEAEQVTVELFRMMHLPGLDAQITIVSPDAAQWLDGFAKDVPALPKIGPLIAAHSLTGVSPSAIYVANASIWNSVKPAEWFVPVYWLPSAGTAPAGTIAVPANDWHAAIDGLFRDQMDAQAEAIHQLYLEERRQAGDAIGSRPSMNYWTALPERFRAASRHQADHIAYKLAAIGCHAIAETTEQRFAFTPDEHEALAEMEHERWAAVQMLDGWQYGEKRDDKAKRTPLLMPYDSLTAEIKDLDRLSVRAVPAQLDRVHRSIVRDLRVLFDVKTTGGEAGHFEQGIASLLTTLVQRYPERAAVFVTRLTTPLEQAAARAALDTAKVRVCVLIDAAATPSDGMKAIITRADSIRLSDTDEVLDFVVRGEGQSDDAGNARIITLDAAGLVTRAPWL